MWQKGRGFWRPIPIELGRYLLLPYLYNDDGGYLSKTSKKDFARQRDVQQEDGKVPIGSSSR